MKFLETLNILNLKNVNYSDFTQNMHFLEFYKEYTYSFACRFWQFEYNFSKPNVVRNLNFMDSTLIFSLEMWILHRINLYCMHVDYGSMIAIFLNFFQLWEILILVIFKCRGSLVGNPTHAIYMSVISPISSYTSIPKNVYFSQNILLNLQTFKAWLKVC